MICAGRAFWVDATRQQERFSVSAVGRDTSDVE